MHRLAGKRLTRGNSDFLEGIWEPRQKRLPFNIFRASSPDPGSFATIYHTTMTRLATLSRTVRFTLPRSGSVGDVVASPRTNTHAGWPSALAEATATWSVRVEVEGHPDPRTGYLVGIDRIDAAMRTHAIPSLLERERTGPQSVDGVLGSIARSLDEHLRPKPSAIELRTEAMTSWRLELSDMPQMILRRRYEFSAAHRLALPDLSEEENADLYGKCSNPHGHGHNYEVEVQVAIASDPQGFSVPELDRTVNECVIDRFDHQHLNLDIDDFADRIPSVENIADRCVELLASPVGGLQGVETLRSVTVWETPRTSCTVLA